MSEAPPAGEASRPGAPAPPFGLYVHVPFCVSHCPYCDFVVVAGRAARGPSNRIGAFIEAVRAELELRADALDERFGPPGSRPPLETLFFGGGTPSLLPAPTLARLIDLIRDRFGLAREAEVTLEANPHPDERGDLAGFVGAGVTRLSFGAQSLDATELRALGRRHAPADVAAAVADARAAGALSVSLDLLYDVPGQTLATWEATLAAALALQPDHLSLYALTLDDPDAEGLTGMAGDHLPLRPGARRWRQRARTGQDEDRAAEMYELADARLAAEGLEWYEISNWARPGHRSRHNMGYWQGRPWEAVGPGAHAFDGVSRRWNAARLDGYLVALLGPDARRPRLPPGGVDADAADCEGTAAMLALRTGSGLPAAGGGTPAIATTIAWGLDTGLLERSPDDRVRLTVRGRLLSDELFVRLV